ncbi:flavodoxin [Helicobacter sp. 13S00401-1]|uniref:flavodoxin n=1 Tax=Helicobacter sp. 13S00401-1 TaxID=1905758 RepID=UPI000BA6EAB3|nr:flavodoxin [Helicobacter sp. 13S00401-1]PAF50714.1 flavodoxin [Helicobacter sp. 13S00401-1]
MAIGLFFGSDNGTTTDVCNKVAKELGDVQLFDVANATKEQLEGFDKLILASSTWGDGELQSDWESFAETLKGVDFSKKTVALIGLGDSDSYSDTFCDALADLKAVAKGAKFIGETSTDGYEFESSKAVENGKFVGLAIDEVNQDDLTDERIKNWVAEIKGKF